MIFHWNANSFVREIRLVFYEFLPRLSLLNYPFLQEKSLECYKFCDICEKSLTLRLNSVFVEFDVFGGAEVPLLLRPSELCKCLIFFINSSLLSNSLYS